MKKIKGLVAGFAFAVTSLVLAGAIALLAVQKHWDQPVKRTPQSAFFHGSIGTEIMPLPFFVALPKLYPRFFQPLGVSAGSALRQFGMNRQLSDERNLPTGFFVSHKRPKSGAPSPVPFVGISCVMCHSTEIYHADGNTDFIIGSGNMNLNLFAWIDSFQNAILAKDLSVKRVVDRYQTETGTKISLSQRLMMQLWFRGIRKTIKDNAVKYGDPFAGSDVMDPHRVPTGPGRTQPFRTLVRRLLDRPGAEMAVYTKVASVFHQDRRQWAQVDGSISDLYSRSSVAAYAAGATVQNMAFAEIVDNIRKASDFTRDLGTRSFFDVFPDQARKVSKELIADGRAIYQQHCHICHGSPSPDKRDWIPGARTGEVVHYKEIGTDSQRVTFRRFADLPDLIHQAFPKNHPFYLERKEIRPGPAGDTRGYINAPIEYAYARAPYLHNASVLTLAELINLNPRRTTFYRGRNLYDPNHVGLISPDSATAAIYFRFDTSRRGNSNQGHDYPWRFEDPQRDPVALKALLAFLKTL